MSKLGIFAFGECIVINRIEEGPAHLANRVVYLGNGHFMMCDPKLRLWSNRVMTGRSQTRSTVSRYTIPFLIGAQRLGMLKGKPLERLKVALEARHEREMRAYAARELSGHAEEAGLTLTAAQKRKVKAIMRAGKR